MGLYVVELPLRYPAALLRGSSLLPIVDYNEHNFMLEGEFILQRKYLLFFDIEKVTFYDDQEGFLEKILGFKDVGTKK